MKPLFAAVGIVFGAFGVGQTLSAKNGRINTNVQDHYWSTLLHIESEVAGLSDRVTALEAERG